MEVSPDSDAWTTELRTETPRDTERYNSTTGDEYLSTLTGLWSGVVD